MKKISNIIVVDKNEVERKELDSKIMQVLKIISKVNKRVSELVLNNNENVEKFNESIVIVNKNNKLFAKRINDIYTIVEVQKKQLNSLFAVMLFQGIVILLLIIGMTNLYFKKIRVEIPISEFRITDTVLEETGD